MTDEEFLKKLGEKVSVLRKTKGLTQKELAQKLETHYTAIVRIERGGVNSTINMLRKIADCLGVEVEELIKIN